MTKLFIITFLILSVFLTGCQQTAEKPEPIAKKIGVQREAFDAKKDPALTAIGRINFRGQKQCTLILVAEDIAVTAGHCFLEEYHLSDMTKDLNPIFTEVNFRANGERRIQDLLIKRVLKAKMKPDYAIVKLNRKIDTNAIKPLKFEKSTLEEIRSKEETLGCAGFNGDDELGDGGFTMTISRNIKIIPESSSKERVDTDCISTYGGSGGALFEKRQNTETNQDEYYLLGVIWGVTDDNFNDKGESVEENKPITSITPVSVFYDELTEIIDRN